MPTVRNTKATYLAAFLIGGVIALLLVAPARSAEIYSVPDNLLPAAAAIAAP